MGLILVNQNYLLFFDFTQPSFRHYSTFMKQEQHNSFFRCFIVRQSYPQKSLFVYIIIVTKAESRLSVP